MIIFEMLAADGCGGVGVGRSVGHIPLFSEFFRRILTNSADFR